MARKATSKTSSSNYSTGSVAWVQHFIHHLAPPTARRDSASRQRKAPVRVVSEAKDNITGFVLANGSMSSNQSGDGDSRSEIKSHHLN